MKNREKSTDPGLSAAERKDLRSREAKEAITDHEEGQRALHSNLERLRAERLAREATAGPMLYPRPELPDNTRIEDVRFSTRIRAALKAAGWKTVGEIREASDATLLGLQDLGKFRVPSEENLGTTFERWRAACCAEGEGEMTANVLARIFTIEIGGKPTLTFEALNIRGAHQLCQEQWLKDDLEEAKSDGVPLWDGKAKLRARFALPDESAVFAEAKNNGQTSEAMMLVYLVELDDHETNEQPVDPGAFPPVRS